MYVPRFTAMDDTEELRALVRTVGSAELVTSGTEQTGWFPVATRLPVLWEDKANRLVMHMARANPHWRAIEADLGHWQAGVPALAVVTGPEAYVSAAYYASKAEHGRVVPTWNYSAVHFAGTVTVHHDPEWLREAVSLLTDAHEQPRAARPDAEPWAVTDAPPVYVDKQLRAIVGVELAISRVEGKAKLSQNRSDADHAGVVRGLRREGGVREQAVAEQMAARRPSG
jgi:transcriptional regulator